MILAALWSGGKDSVYATHLASKEYEVAYLVTMVPEKKDSWMFHFPCVELTELQTKASGFIHIMQKTSGEKGKELKDLENVLNKLEIDGVVSGTIASNYQKTRIDEVCKKLKIKHIAPLWQRNQEEVLREELKAGFEIIITGVFAEGFDESWLGRKIDEEVVKELILLNKKFGISISGEGGEYETFVLNCPLFKKRIEILNFKRVWDKKTHSGYLVVKELMKEKRDERS